MRTPILCTTAFLVATIAACQTDQPPPAKTVTGTPQLPAPTDTGAAPVTTAAPGTTATDKPIGSAAPGAATDNPTGSAAPGAATDNPTGSAAPDPSDYKTCAVDSDCEIVDRAGCCHNGYKEAIARGKGNAYLSANACTKKVMCPQYIVRDTRTARCNPQTHQCEMVGKTP